MSAPESLLLADGYERALIGYTTHIGCEEPVAVYDRDKCIELLVMRDGMSYEEADEYFAYNTEGAGGFPRSPLYLVPCDYEWLMDHFAEVGNE